MPDCSRGNNDSLGKTAFRLRARTLSAPSQTFGGAKGI
jgi:hypothetical protein